MVIKTSTDQSRRFLSNALTTWSNGDMINLRMTTWSKEVNMLSAVSETAIYTLKARVYSYVQSEGLINDPVGEKLLDGLVARMDNLQKKRIGHKMLPQSLRSYIVLRALKYDQTVSRFIHNYPEGLVVSLGCGLDTRYWRTNLKPEQYIELDLPEMINLKKEIYGRDLPYETIGQSVLDMSWIDQIENINSKHVLFIAEGLFMYLPEPSVVSLFRELASRFDKSEIIFEVVSKKYTEGIYKKMVEWKMKNRMGSAAGQSFNYGVHDPQEVERYHQNLKAVEEWSYIENDKAKPNFIKLLRHFKNVYKITVDNGV